MRDRIIWLDVARTLAIAGMVIYHFCYDLVIFGLLEPALVTTGPLRSLAILVAASFIALAGVSLQVAQGSGIRWASFLRRLAVLVVAAVVISALTYVWVPNSYIFFGILHAIALFSVLGLAFLWLPFWVCTAAAVGVFVLPSNVSLSVFDYPLMNWSGLGTYIPPSLDYEPIFPWFAAFLLGMTAAKLMAGTRLLAARPVQGNWRLIAWPGQRSLWVYLAHQPVLIALIWLAIQLR